MNKFIIAIGLLLSFPNLSISQDIQSNVSKLEQFVSKTGVMIKFINYYLPEVKFKTGVAESKIRKLVSGEEVRYFHQISIKGKYKDKTASIAYEDILEILKAIEVLKKEVSVDMQTSPDYLENKFITDDGLQIGYYISKGKAGWYVALDKYGSDSTLFFKDTINIENTFQTAKEKIDDLRKF